MNTEGRYVVIGTGLAGYAVIRRLVSAGIKPLVFDAGDFINRGLQEKVSALAHKDLDAWNVEDHEMLRQGIRETRKLPIKRYFGSDEPYLSKKSKCDEFQADNHDLIPPMSSGIGGLTSVWGAAAMMPAKEDLPRWEVDLSRLFDHANQFILTHNYFGFFDALENVSALPVEYQEPQPISDYSQEFVTQLSKLNGDNIHVGTARMLFDSKSCNRCGYCLAGCVKNCFFKVERQIAYWSGTAQIELKRNCKVYSLTEEAGRTTIKLASGEQIQFHASKVFVCAGAIATNAILMRSPQAETREVNLHSTCGFVRAHLAAFGLPDWSFNRQPSCPMAYVEYKTPTLGDHFHHCQVSGPNEFLLARLGLLGKKNPEFKKRLLKPILNRVMISNTNLHSDYGPSISMRLSGAGELIAIRYMNTKHALSNIKTSHSVLSEIFRVANLYTLPIGGFDTGRGGGAHVGGGFVAKNEPRIGETDLVGRPSGFDNVFVADSTTFASVPATTLGLLTLANADLIATQVIDA